jgi:hypothetical protein
MRLAFLRLLRRRLSSGVSLELYKGVKMFSVTIPVPTVLIYVAVVLVVILIVKFLVRFVMG